MASWSNTVTAQSIDDREIRNLPGEENPSRILYCSITDTYFMTRDRDVGILNAQTIGYRMPLILLKITLKRLGIGG